MKITHDYSRYSDAQEPLLRFVEALVAYAPDRAELERICIAIWPECDIYKGHTHWRVMPEGQTMHHDGRPSFYVDFAESEEQAS